MSTIDLVDAACAAWIELAERETPENLARATSLRVAAERRGLGAELGDCMRQLLALGELG